MKKTFKVVVKKTLNQIQTSIPGLIDPRNNLELDGVELITIGYKTMPETPYSEQYGIFIYVPRECVQDLINQLEKVKY